MEFKRSTLHINQKAMLFILTGDSRVLPDELKPKRERIKRKKLESPAPDSYMPRKRFKRTNPANPHMNEKAAWMKEPKFESRSDDIVEFAKRAVYFRILSNRQSTFTGAHRERPCHRDMTEDEKNGNVKVGPANV